MHHLPQCGSPRTCAPEASGSPAKVEMMVRKRSTKAALLPAAMNSFQVNTGPFIALVLLSLGAFGFPVAGRATDYYVDTSNPAASDANPGSAASPWKTISKANQTLVAGDTAYIKHGTYSDYVAPVNSGTASSLITYRNFSNDVVVVQNAAYGIHLDGKSRIAVQGITFTNLDAMMILENKANNNVIAYCTFVHMRTFSSYCGSRIWLLASSNWVHHCTFAQWGECSGGVAGGGVLEIGFDDGDSTYPGNYNLIENYTLYDGGHHTLGVHGNHNVIRNNYSYNTVWTAGKGERTLYLNGYAAYCQRNLIENNRFGYSYVPCDTWGAPGTQISTPLNIFRRNYFFYNNLSGIQFSTTDNYHAGPNSNYVYHNTFMGNGWQLDGGSDDQQRSQIGFQNWSTSFTVKSNVIKNNLFYDAPRVYGYNSASASDQTFANNYNGDASGNPLFLNATNVTSPIIPANPADTNYPNLAVQTNSPVIDAGGALTTITSASGSGTALVVADANYFMDGWGIVQGDRIQLLGSTQTARITAVNYATRTVTVDTNLVWTQNQGIALPYNGNAPDIGAYESGSAPASTNSGPPVVTTVASLTVGYPTNSVALRSSASDPAGRPLTISWTQLDGPAPASFSVTNQTNTVVTVAVSGDYSFRVSASNGSDTSSADTTVTFAPDPNALSFQATNGTIASPFTVQNGYIVQSVLTTTVTNGGRAAYAFTLPVRGNYIVLALVSAPDESANSFFANIDAEPVDPDMIWDVPVTSGFETRAISWRGTGDSAISQFSPKFFNLSAGAHTLIIRGREAGAELAQVQVCRAIAKAPLPPANLRVISGL